MAAGRNGESRFQTPRFRLSRVIRSDCRERAEALPRARPLYFLAPPVLNKTRPARATVYPNTWTMVMLDPKARTEPEMRSYGSRGSNSISSP